MFVDFAAHVLCVVEYSLIRETNNSKPLANHVRVASPVVRPRLILFVNVTITFDNEGGVTKKEICYVIADLMLPSGFESRQSARTQSLPQQPVSRRFLVS
jgi:hypothetical protein